MGSVLAGGTGRSATGVAISTSESCSASCAAAEEWPLVSIAISGTSGFF